MFYVVIPILMIVKSLNIFDQKDIEGALLGTVGNKGQDVQNVLGIKRKTLILLDKSLKKGGTSY